MPKSRFGSEAEIQTATLSQSTGYGHCGGTRTSGERKCNVSGANSYRAGITMNWEPSAGTAPEMLESEASRAVLGLAAAARGTGWADERRGSQGRQIRTESRIAGEGAGLAAIAARRGRHVVDCMAQAGRGRSGRQTAPGMGGRHRHERIGVRTIQNRLDQSLDAMRREFSGRES
jgi:hypothetical protein